MLNLTKTTNNATVSTRTVNNLNQITSGYSYDANGNRTNTSGNYSVYVYDDENQLIEWYNNPAWYSGSKKTQFIYDGKGRLRRKIESNHTGSDQYGYTWGITSDTRYIYSGMLCIQERNGSNTPEVSYTRGSDLSGTLEGAGGIGGLLARSHGYSAGTWSTHSFYHADGNGNITMMLDSSQSTVATYKYDPYGNLFTSSGTLAAANLYRFSSKLWCANAGLYYYGYRFYDPLLQRWLNRDPRGETGFEGFLIPFGGVDLNTYRFAANQPVSRFDAFGLHPDVDIGPVPGPKCPPGLPKIPPNVKDCAKDCFLAHLPMRAVCAIGCIGTGPGYFGCMAVCNAAVHLSQLTCTAACIAGSK